MGLSPFGDLLDSPMMTTDTPLFHKEKHINYWLRCLRSPLPHQYTHNDSNRMTLVFFTISALDLLGVLFTRTTAIEREEYINWIYGCQHPQGGFRGFPGTDFGSRATTKNAVWDPANVPATYFALGALVVIGDDLSRLDRRNCLRWLTRMQRPNGSFGETLGPEDKIEGGMDTRFGYCAMVARWILRGNHEGDLDGVPDIRVDDLVDCIRESQTFDGGISEEPFHEAHAGFTYCAIGALALINRLPPEVADPVSPYEGNSKNGRNKHAGLTSVNDTIRWLISRMTTTIDEDDYECGDDEGDSFSDNNSSSNELEPAFSNAGTSSTATTPDSTSFVKLRSTPVPQMEGVSFSATANPNAGCVFYPMHSQWAGFNGRVNKIADTCYVFWAGGSLAILNNLPLLSNTPIRRYLCEKTQHTLAGGFSKYPGDPPDIYHAYLGLAALALLDVGKAGEEGVLAKDVRHSATNASRKGGAPKPVLDAQHPDPRHGANEVEMRGGADSDGDGDGDSGVGVGVEVDTDADAGNVGVGGPSGKTSPARRWSGHGQKMDMQTISADMMEQEGWGEGGEVGDGGGVLRRLDPALCMSVRARKWVEGLRWRREILGR